MGDYEPGGNESPQYTASFLFLVELAQSFRNCNLCRQNNDIQGLLRNLESACLSMTGYYNKDKDKNDKVQLILSFKLFSLREDIDKVVKSYEATQDLKIPKEIFRRLYDIEQELRYYWKASKLQMSITASSDLDDF